MLLLAHAQFHYRDAAEVIIAIASSGIIITIFELSILSLSPRCGYIVFLSFTWISLENRLTTTVLV